MPESDPHAQMELSSGPTGLASTRPVALCGNEIGLIKLVLILFFYSICPGSGLI
jgi:hypothetical protein